MTHHVNSITNATPCGPDEILVAMADEDPNCHIVWDTLSAPVPGSSVLGVFVCMVRVILPTHATFRPLAALRFGDNVPQEMRRETIANVRELCRMKFGGPT
jgi:hypothetical protein